MTLEEGFSAAHPMDRLQLVLYRSEFRCRQWLVGQAVLHEERRLRRRL